MQSTRKIGFLILLLAIPIFLVLFFQFFSTSHYNIPIYYESGLDSLTECNSSQGVHRLSTFQVTDLPGEELPELTFRDYLWVIYPLPDECEEDCQQILEELVRVQGVLYRNVPLRVVLMSGSPPATASEVAETYLPERANWSVVRGTEPQFTSFLQCELVLPQPDLSLSQTLVMVDEEGRIRGYYEGTSPEEVDRLIAEIRILDYSTNLTEK